jgi:hypothetical protein
VIAVRPATVDDAGAMSAVLIGSITELCVADHRNRPDILKRWLANKSPDGVRQWFGNPETRLFVAEADGAVAAAGGISAKREVILNYVSPRHRFTGVSTTLLDALEAGLGPGEATLHSTGTAHRFYLSRGWTDAGPPEDHWGMPAYPMRKRL